MSEDEVATNFHVTYGRKRTFKMQPFGRLVTVSVAGLASEKRAVDILNAIAAQQWGWRPRRFWEIWRLFDSEEANSLWERICDESDAQERGETSG